MTSFTAVTFLALMTLFSLISSRALLTYRTLVAFKSICSIRSILSFLACGTRLSWVTLWPLFASLTLFTIQARFSGRPWRTLNTWWTLGALLTRCWLWALRSLVSSWSFISLRSSRAYRALDSNFTSVSIFPVFARRSSWPNFAYRTLFALAPFYARLSVGTIKSFGTLRPSRTRYSI